MSRLQKASATALLLVFVLCVLQFDTVDAQITEETGHHEKCNKVNHSSFLWMIERDPPAYLFGTVHVPYTRVWADIAPVVKRTFDRISHVFFELDLTDPYTIGALSRCQLLPANRHLLDFIPYSMYLRIEKHLSYVRRMIPYWMSPDQKTRGIYAEYLFRSMTMDWQRKRPVWVMLMLNSLTEMDVRNRGVPVLDLFLAQEAHRRNKRSGALEDVPEQCEPLNRLNLSQVIFALNVTLTHHEMKRRNQLSSRFVDSATKDLIKHYNCGNLSAVLFQEESGPVPITTRRLLLPPQQRLLIREIDNYFRAELIDKRNGRMAMRVKEIIRHHPHTAFFFALGAGHFIGEKSTIIDHLRNAGFNIRHLPRDHPGPNFRHESKTKPAPLRPVIDDSGIPSFVIRQHLNLFKPKSKHRSRKRLPEFRPKYVHFRDLWIRIEDFTESSIPEKSNKVEKKHSTSQDSSSNTATYPVSSFHVVSHIILCIVLKNAFTIFL